MLSVYNIAWAAATPFVRAVLASRSDYRLLQDRFGPAIPAAVDRPVWIHACSVGEVNVAVPFLRALHDRHPDSSLLLTVSTASGRARAESILDGQFPITWFPFDQRRTVTTFLDELRPRVLILVETELWPNILRESDRRSIPVALINGRISDKHFTRYRRARRLFAPVLRSVALAAMQTDEYARRIIALGADPQVARVTGSLKFDTALAPPDPEVTADLRRKMGIPSDARVVVFGSTRPGDEALARLCWDAVKSRFPNVYFVIAPRHIDRAPQALEPFAGEDVMVRSRLNENSALRGERIILLDTVGELTAVYGMADIAVVGGSFSRDVQGHNPIEPAALGVPVLFGPCMRNFSDSAAMLESSGGAIQSSADTLPDTLASLLESSDRMRTMGECARRLVRAQAGALSRTLEVLEPLLNPAPIGPPG